MVRKIAVTLDHRTVADLDRWVQAGRYPNRSRALQFAVNLLMERDKRSRFSRELAKLNRADERRIADEGIGDGSWADY
jgi:Arc/MetJ-type ribon-helix-helix transcriptional regulator